MIRDPILQMKEMAEECHRDEALFKAYSESENREDVQNAAI